MQRADHGVFTEGATTMSTIDNNLKSLVCGVGALAITAVLSWTFVQSTAIPPAARAAHVAQMAQMAKVNVQPRHLSLGRFEPAVLVD
jgi:hypothetical protein